MMMYNEKEGKEMKMMMNQLAMQCERMQRLWKEVQ